MTPGDHAVQFYSNDEQLLSVLTRYVGSALVGGDVAVVIATPAHRAALDRRLAARGLDVEVARSEGRYLAADAQATLDRFTSAEGSIDRTRAEAVIGELLTRASGVIASDGGPSNVFAFGEMVALLVAAGNADAAVELEEIWNDLATRYPLTLACGYPMNVFTPRDAASFVRICGQHGRVFHVSDLRRAQAADRLT